MSIEKNKPTTYIQLLKMLEAAKNGDPSQLNQFIENLYAKGKIGLVKLIQSESEAAEYYATAVAKFWQVFVVGNKRLPETNIEGYIFRMARNLFLDDKRKSAKKIKLVSPESVGLENRKEFAAELKSTDELQEASDLKALKQKAMNNAIAKLSESCQALFNTILETGIEKSSKLYKLLGLKDARAVTVKRYECTHQLRRKAAIELELLMKN